jgi:hypothetical protein
MDRFNASATDTTTTTTPAMAAAVADPVTGGHRHGCGRHIPVVFDSRRLLDNMMSGLNGPNSFLTQTRTAAKLTTKDLRETEAHAADFMASTSRFSGRDRRLLDFLSGSSGPNSILKQTRDIGKLTMDDLKETEAHAADFMAPTKGSRFSGRDRRLLDN